MHFRHLQPILQYFYHQIYHTNSNSNDCLGGKSVSRYVLCRISKVLRKKIHFLFCLEFQTILEFKSNFSYHILQVHFDKGNQRASAFEEYSKCHHWNKVKRCGTEKRCKSFTENLSNYQVWVCLSNNLFAFILVF